VAVAIPGAVRRQAAVPAGVCNPGPRDEEETARRRELEASAGQQQLSVLQPSDLR